MCSSNTALTPLFCSSTIHINISGRSGGDERITYFCRKGIHMNHMISTVFLAPCVLVTPALGQDGGASSPKKFLHASDASENSIPVTFVGPGHDNILTFLLQDFEGTTFPPAGWTSQGSGSAIWTRSTAASGYGIGAASAFADFYNIQSGSFSLITPTFANAVAGDSLKFDHAYATYQSEVDQLQLSTSTDGGSTWVTLVTLTGGVSGPLVTAPPTTNPFVPSAAQWATKRYALPLGTNKIRFTGISAYGNNLYLDNIVIGTPYTNDVGVASIDAPRSNIAPGSYLPKATFKNYGLATQSFPATLTISPGGYTSTQNVTNLAAGATQQVTFANWTPTVGSYTLTAMSQLGADENRTNDTLATFHIVSNVTRAVLLEFATGTWCQWCPCGDSTAERLLRVYPDLVVLAYHGPAGSTSDPWTVYNGNNILSLLSLSAYPTAILDRQNAPGDYTTWTGYCANRYTNYGPTPITIAVQSITYNSTTRQLDVTLGLTSNCDLPFQYKVNYVLTEDNLVYSQTGNSTCPGSTSWVHKWIVRNLVNGATGENVNAGTWGAGQTITKTLSTTLNSGWVAPNCKLSVFVYKDNPALGMAEVQNAITTPVVVTGVNELPGGVPTSYELSQNHPNPFNPSTNIRISVAKEGFVSLKVYDISGREVLTAVNEVLSPGYYNVQVDASTLSSGVYFYKLTTNGFKETKKMTLLK
jgi:hypothetical protein